MTARTIIVGGVDGVVPKLCYLAQELREHHGLETVFLSDDRIGMSDEISRRWGFRFIRTGGRRSGLRDQVAPVMSALRRIDPLHLELYLGASIPTQLAHVLTAKAASLPYAVWCRGGELRWNSLNAPRRAANRTALMGARKVFLRELWMPDVVKRLRLFKPQKAVFLSNRIPWRQESPSNGPNGDVLFLNSFVPWRHPDLLVEAAALISQTHPKIRFRLVGDTSGMESYRPAKPGYQRHLKALVQTRRLENVAIEPFTATPDDYYRTASAFVLPADVVYVNNALLEAMERGVVPIIADVDGARLIVRDGIDGFVVPQDAQAIADKIALLIDTPDLWEKMASSARERIRTNFNITTTADYLVNEVYPRLWRARK